MAWGRRELPARPARPALPAPPPGATSREPPSGRLRNVTQHSARHITIPANVSSCFLM